MAIKIDKSAMSKTNTTLLTNRKIEWIFVHYTAGTSSSSGTAKAVAKFFNNPARQASADFIVDDKNIVQYNPDIRNRYTWAVGGQKYDVMTTSEGGKYYNKTFNYNSISIEMCSRKKSTKTLNATDKDWYFTDEVVDNTVALVKYLMKEYKIDAKHVIMHHHRTGKICPNPWCVNEGRLKYYHNFIDRISDKHTNATITAKCHMYEEQNDWCKSLETFNKGQKIDIVKDIGNGWSKVKYCGEVGYIKNTVLKYNDGTDLSGYVTRKTTAEVALRTDRKVNKSTKVKTVPADTLFTLLGKDSKWAKIKYEGEKYYVWKSKTTVK